MIEFLKLLWIRIVVYFYETIEFIEVVFRYYPNKRFRQQDLSLLSKYIFTSPYSISKNYLLARGADDLYQYGETPLTTLARIVKECQISEKDIVYELGCGRARTCFWLASFVKCRAIGIEQIPTFVEYANQVKNKFHVTGVKICEGNYLDYSYMDASVIYIYGTCLDEPVIKLLIRKFAKLPPGTKIITISYPLTDYVDYGQFALFNVVHRFEASFPWGKGAVYMHVRNDHQSHK
ncbi:MAG: class I SAM-dependent methyltransferase [Parachlamydiaceae bacterium]|nr:class I SAM-dependent methyltransferase [Parachlamydiaceae bacterium]